ncbi:MAG: hypothetical protein ABFS10_09305 [Bacteroidota bacterium]
MIHKLLLLSSLLLLMTQLSHGQYSQLQLGDTTKAEYPYILPLLGEKAYEKGFDLPKPVGLMLNYFWASQDVVISEIAVGFEGAVEGGVLEEIPLTDISEIIEFEEVHAVANSITVRPDVWIFPFLNLYGIVGKTFATTSVKLSSPVQMASVAELDGFSYGMGTTGAFGLGKYFLVLDGNWVWTKMSNFEDPVQSRVFSQRLGRAFHIGDKPESNVAFWVGGMRLKMGNITQGTIVLNEVLPPETWDRRDEIVANYWTWYDGLGPLDPMKVVANNVLTPIVNNLEHANGEGTVEYRLLKEPKQEWNVIIGGQYQFNKSWQFRAEGGIIGNRKSLLLSLNYRFGV